MKLTPKIIYQKNDGMSCIQNTGYIPLKQRIETMVQAGKKLTAHRINSQLIDVDDENIESALFGLGRYHDKLDLCETIKRNRDRISGIMSTYSIRKAEEAAEQAKADTEAKKVSKTDSNVSQESPEPKNKQAAGE
jgi:hypothetical protein